MGSLITRGLGLGSNLLVTLGLSGASTSPPLAPEWTIPLITEPDGFEVVRDKLAEILALETAMQQSQAAAEGLDPAGWAFGVYLERLNPWEQYLNSSYTAPFVNVSYDNGPFDSSSSNMSTMQVTDSRFNIDCYACAVATETENGHLPSDKGSALAAHKIARIVRRILMHDKYRCIGLGGDDGPVWERWLSDRQALRPPSGDPAVQSVTAVRLSLVVKHEEIVTFQSPQVFTSAGITFQHETDGQVVAALQYEVQ